MGGLWCFNGIDAVSESYLLQASPAEDARVLGELKYRNKHTTESHFGVKAGIDVNDLSETGWGVGDHLPADAAVMALPVAYKCVREFYEQ